MKSCLAVAVVALLCLGSGFSIGAEEASDIVEVFDPGVINWTRGVFVSRGVGSPPAKTYDGSSNDQEIVRNDARNHALQNMPSVMLKANIRANMTVGDIAVGNEMMMNQIEILAKGAKPVKQEYLSDGTVEITLQLNMFGGFSQLILPVEIEQIEAIKTVSRDKASSFGDDDGSSLNPDAKSYTGLVVDARGTKVKPALVPVIMDEEGKDVYGEAFVSREFAVQKGMCRYLRDIKAAQLDGNVAHSPMTVKGLRADTTDPSRIVISNADASKIRSASEHLSFLKQCRVIVVMD